MSTSSTARTGRESGPLVGSALVFALLTVAGAALEPTVVRPSNSPQEVLEHLAIRSPLLSVAAAAQVGSALSLVGFAAVLVKRLRRGGEETAALNVSITAARLAATSLVVGALVGWTAVQSVVLGDAASTMALGPSGSLRAVSGSSRRSGCSGSGWRHPACLRESCRDRWAWPWWYGGWRLSTLGAAALVVPTLYPLLPVGKLCGAFVLFAAAVVLGREWPQPSAPRPAWVRFARSARRGRPGASRTR
ncbi:hypothetical protein WEH80_26785 [Actinomycetes bacterium KLBMP 9759]